MPSHDELSSPTTDYRRLREKSSSPTLDSRRLWRYRLAGTPSSKLASVVRFASAVACVVVVYILWHFFAGSLLQEMPEVVIQESSTPFAFTEFDLGSAGAEKVVFLDKSISYRIKQWPDDSKCVNKTLIIAIPSKSSNFHKRDAIRNSWLKNVPSRACYRFVVGLSGNESVDQALLRESNMQRDLMFFDLLDTYANLPFKTHAILRWHQANCLNVPYLLKADDDSVVDVERLLYWIDFDFTPTLEFKQIPAAAFCKVWEGTKVRRNPQDIWYVSHVAYPKEVYPDYCNGPAYLLTAPAIDAILEIAPKTRFVTVEDVFFTGIMAEAAGVKRIDRSSIFTNELPVSSKCQDGVPFFTTTYVLQQKSIISAVQGFLSGSTIGPEENEFLPALNKIKSFKLHC